MAWPQQAQPAPKAALPLGAIVTAVAGFLTFIFSFVQIAKVDVGFGGGDIGWSVWTVDNVGPGLFGVGTYIPLFALIAAGVALAGAFTKGLAGKTVGGFTLGQIQLVAAVFAFLLWLGYLVNIVLGEADPGLGLLLLFIGTAGVVGGTVLTMLDAKKAGVATAPAYPVAGAAPSWPQSGPQAEQPQWNQPGPQAEQPQWQQPGPQAEQSQWNQPAPHADPAQWQQPGPQPEQPQWQQPAAPQQPEQPQWNQPAPAPPPEQPHWQQPAAPEQPQWQQPAAPQQPEQWNQTLAPGQWQPDPSDVTSASPPAWDQTIVGGQPGAPGADPGQWQQPVASPTEPQPWQPAPAPPGPQPDPGPGPLDPQPAPPVDPQPEPAPAVDRNVLFDSGTQVIPGPPPAPPADEVERPGDPGFPSPPPSNAP